MCKLRGSNIILSRDDFLRFLENITHPSAEYIAKKKELLKSLDDIQIRKDCKGIIVDVPDLSIPEDKK
ncbi:hypothetical protein GKG41_12580 [Lactonifactor sp. BIOML-A5]|nr:hypothetical protein [Lactonifactor sp. BIOML-A5]MSB69348.1 hypothetical protein [Lactonifactor sp. BIOML-A7]